MKPKSKHSTHVWKYIHDYLNEWLCNCNSLMHLLSNLDHHSKINWINRKFCNRFTHLRPRRTYRRRKLCLGKHVSEEQIPLLGCMLWHPILNVQRLNSFERCLDIGDSHPIQGSWLMRLPYRTKLLHDHACCTSTNKNLRFCVEVTTMCDSGHEDPSFG